MPSPAQQMGIEGNKTVNIIQLPHIQAKGSIMAAITHVRLNFMNGKAKLGIVNSIRRETFYIKAPKTKNTHESRSPKHKTWYFSSLLICNLRDGHHRWCSLAPVRNRKEWHIGRCRRRDETCRCRRQLAPADKSGGQDYFLFLKETWFYSLVHNN